MKHNQATTHSTAPVPKGIVMDSKGIGFTTVGLPMADHFFQATSFMVKQVGSNLVMAFGSQTAFPKSNQTEYKLAIEIIFPIEVAAKFLYLQNWAMKSISGKEPFAEAVGKAVQKDLATYEPPKKYDMPDGSNFRTFPSNFATMSFSTGQAAIEFFEAPPGMIVEAIFKKSGWRPNSDIRAILTVILPPVELYQFLLETKKILEKVAQPNQELEVDNV